MTNLNDIKLWAKKTIMKYDALKVTNIKLKKKVDELTKNLVGYDIVKEGFKSASELMSGRGIGLDLRAYMTEKVCEINKVDEFLSLLKEVKDTLNLNGEDLMHTLLDLSATNDVVKNFKRFEKFEYFVFDLLDSLNTIISEGDYDDKSKILADKASILKKYIENK